MTRRSPENVEHIGLIGGGTIGASWAAYFLARGYRVTITDPAPEIETFIRNYIDRAWPDLEQLGTVTSGSDPARLTVESDPAAALKAVDFIQESAPERLELKHAIYEKIEPIISAETIISSSSSGLMPGELQRHARHPERFVVSHPFNPPHLIPLVEVVGGEHTDPAAVDWTLDFYEECGKKPIRLNKEVPGHVSNRLQAAIWREAVHLVAEGVASLADVDRAIAHGPGLRWAIFGPNLTFLLAAGGHEMEVFIERYGPSFHRWWDDLGSPRLTEETVRLLVEGVDEAKAGRTPEALAAERDAKLVAILKAVSQ